MSFSRRCQLSLLKDTLTEDDNIVEVEGKENLKDEIEKIGELLRSFTIIP